MVVEPGCVATVTRFGDVAIEIGDVGAAATSGGGARRNRVGRELDPVYLSIFAHRFMGIAEQMGRTLQVPLLHATTKIYYRACAPPVCRILIDAFQACCNSCLFFMAFWSWVLQRKDGRKRTAPRRGVDSIV